MKKGFTLAEMIVVMAVLAVVGTVVLTIFIRTLRGANKAQILSAIKQNGQSILETMDKNIRNSDNIVCPFYTSPTQMTVDSHTITIVKNGIYTRYRFIPPDDKTPLLGRCHSKNGCIISDSPVLPTPSPLPSDIIKTFTSGLCETTFESPQILTDTNPQTGVSVVSGSFTRSRQAGFRDIVTIKFDLVPGVKAPQVVAGQIDAVTFQTTIELR